MTEDGPIERVLPLVVRMERADPPDRTDALQAAARAVLFMLTAEEPEWQQAVQAWDSYRIRKVVRRARGADWRRVGDLPGITVTDGTAEVRVFPPIPLDGWPPELSRLQVGGTELDETHPPPPVDAGMPRVLMSPTVEMSAGKAMAQAGHAAQLGWRSLTPELRSAWHRHDFALAVRTADEPTWTRERALGRPIVRDAGFTEIAPNSETALFVPSKTS